MAAKEKSTKSTTSAKATDTGVATAVKPAKKAPAKAVAATMPVAQAASCCGGGTCTVPTYDQISHRAYEIWVAKGYPQGQDLENWKQAEAELL